MKRIALLVMLLTSSCSPTAFIPTPTLQPTPTSTPQPSKTPTTTATPVIQTIYGIEFRYFTPQAIELIRLSLANLEQCSPEFLKYIRNNSLLFRSSQSPNYHSEAYSNGVIIVRELSLLSPPTDLQPVLVMALLVHETRHVEQARLGLQFPNTQALEADANRYFAKLIADCGNDIPAQRFYDGAQAWAEQPH